MPDFVNDPRKRAALGMIPMGRIAGSIFSSDADVFFVPGEVPAQKNGQQIGYKTLKKSPQVVTYLQYASTVYAEAWRQVIKGAKQSVDHYGAPLYMGLHFVRGTRGRFDWNNMTHIVTDYLVNRGGLRDDDVDNLILFPLRIGEAYNSYAPESPGVFIAFYRCDPMDTTIDFPPDIVGKAIPFSTSRLQLLREKKERASRRRK